MIAHSPLWIRPQAVYSLLMPYGDFAQVAKSYAQPNVIDFTHTTSRPKPNSVCNALSIVMACEHFPNYGGSYDLLAVGRLFLPCIL